MENFLQSEGYRVLGARDGTQAVELYSRHKQEIAAVVLDIGLPKLNGWEVFLRMKKRSGGRKSSFCHRIYISRNRSRNSKGGTERLDHETLPIG